MLNSAKKREELDQVCVLVNSLQTGSKYSLVYFGLVTCSLLDFLYTGEIVLRHLKK